MTARAVSQKGFPSFGTSPMQVLMIGLGPGATVFESMKGIMNLKNRLPKIKKSGPWRNQS